MATDHPPSFVRRKRMGSVAGLEILQVGVDGVVLAVGDEDDAIGLLRHELARGPKSQAFESALVVMTAAS